ncbi:MAG: MmcQ/YjbR family DNA-binding protein [Anaerolineae bacterium]
MEQPQHDAIDKLRRICLALPEAVEDGNGVGTPSFKVKDKIFAMHHPMHERPSMWCKAPQGFQAMLLDHDPHTFFVPPYVGHHGWIGVWLDIELDWKHTAELIEQSYRMTAPKRLQKLI